MKLILRIMFDQSVSLQEIRRSEMEECALLLVGDNFLKLGEFSVSF